MAFIYDVFISKGVCFDASNCWCVYGREFVPYIPIPECDCCFCWTPKDDVSNSALDVSELWPGHEAFITLFYVKTGTCCWDGCITHSLYDPDGCNYWNYSWNIGLDCNRINRTWVYYGLKCKELDKDGTYCIVWCGCGSGGCNCFSCTQCVTLTNLCCSRMCLVGGDSGFMWVDGCNIWYTDSVHEGYKHCIKNSGSTYGSAGVSNAGHIWVPTGSNVRYLEYVDCNGCIRRTHDAGKCYWDSGNVTMSNVGSSNAGYIWQDDGYLWSHLIFVAADGQTYRLGNGSPYNNCG